VNTSKTEEIIKEITKHKLKPKQIIEKYGEETLKQIITYLNSQGLSIGDIAAKLNLKSTSHLKQLLRKLGVELKKTETHYTKPLAEDRTQELLEEAQQNPKVMETVRYILENNKPPPWLNKLTEKQLAQTILWLNHVEKWSLRKISKTLRKTVQTLSLTIKKHGAQPRKPKRKPIENPEDRAYLAGLIAGDLTVRINRGSLIAQIGTTHYTPWHHLFHTLRKIHINNPRNTKTQTRQETKLRMEHLRNTTPKRQMDTANTKKQNTPMDPAKPKTTTTTIPSRTNRLRRRMAHSIKTQQTIR